MTPPLLNWTGHPLVDVGIATLCAIAEKDRPEELTDGDLRSAAQRIEAAYAVSAMSVYLLSVFTKNSPYTNHTTGPEKRAQSIARLLNPSPNHRDPGIGDQLCIFSGRPATHLLERTQMPMLTGTGVMNFFPAGRTSLPVAFQYLLALQALPLGGRRCEGRMLIVYCDHPHFTISFARKYLADNERLLDLARRGTLSSKKNPSNNLYRELEGGVDSQGRPQLPDSKKPFSLILDDLVAIATETDSGKLATTNASFTVYFMSNELRTPNLQIEHIPGTFVCFLQDLNSGGFAKRWNSLVARYWRSRAMEKNAEKKRHATPSKQLRAGQARNPLYEALFDVFRRGFIDIQAGARFVSRYLLANRASRNPAQIKSSHPTPISRLVFDRVDWSLTSLFLMRVIGMDKLRVEKIRQFADRLASAIHKESDRKLLNAILYSEDQYKFQRALVSAQVRYQKRQNELLFGLDEFVQVFLAEDAARVVPWSLVRDLITIRLIEELARKHHEEGPAEFALFEAVDDEEDTGTDEAVDGDDSE